MNPFYYELKGLKAFITQYVLPIFLDILDIILAFIWLFFPIVLFTFCAYWSGPNYLSDQVKAEYTLPPLGSLFYGALVFGFFIFLIEQVQNGIFYTRIAEELRILGKMEEQRERWEAEDQERQKKQEGSLSIQE